MLFKSETIFFLRGLKAIKKYLPEEATNVTVRSNVALDFLMNG